MSRGARYTHGERESLDRDERRRYGMEVCTRLAVTYRVAPAAEAKLEKYFASIRKFLRGERRSKWSGAAGCGRFAQSAMRRESMGDVAKIPFARRASLSP